MESPLRDVGPGDFDVVVVRENTEGEYSGIGGRVHRGRPTEVAVETSVFTRAGIERDDPLRVRVRPVARSLVA